MKQEFEIIIVGDSQIGKTTWVERLRTGEFIKEYKPTKVVSLSKLSFMTNYGPMVLNIRDIAGDCILGHIGHKHIGRVDGTILMFDLTNIASFNHLPKWENALKQCKINCPNVFVGNKADYKELQVTPPPIQKMVTEKYFHIAAKSNYQIEQPFLYLLQQLTGKDDLIFIVEAPIVPPTIGV